MNQRDREMLQRVYDCLGTMKRLNPRNPADLKAKLRNHTLLLKSSAHLYDALSHLAYGDYEFAGEHLDDAECILAPSPVEPLDREQSE